MRLNLNKIIEVSGSQLPFICELDAQRMLFPSVLSFVYPPQAQGLVKNGAGALTLVGDISAEMVRVCDRCTCEYHQEKTLHVEVELAAELQDEENPDIFPIDPDGWLDLSDVLETCFILDMEARSLCQPDCAGLCQTCGANLNLGKCGCRAETDPRLAVLGQLFDMDE